MYPSTPGVHQSFQTVTASLVDLTSGDGVRGWPIYNIDYSPKIFSVSFQSVCGSHRNRSGCGRVEKLPWLFESDPLIVKASMRGRFSMRKLVPKYETVNSGWKYWASD